MSAALAVAWLTLRCGQDLLRFVDESPFCLLKCTGLLVMWRKDLINRLYNTSCAWIIT